MKNYQVVIERHAIYEITAESYEDAENQAWDQYEPGDLSDAITAEILIIEG
jgi:hypothetical protein